MKTLQIPSVIRPATKQDVFGPNDVPICNAIYFIKDGDDVFNGPYSVDENTDQLRFIYLYIFRRIYVLTDSEEGFCFLLKLRIGERSDIAKENELFFNKTYYTLESPTICLGPLVLRSSTDVNDLGENLNSGRLFVIDEEQTFQPFKIKKSA